MHPRSRRCTRSTDLRIRLAPRGPAARGPLAAPCERDASAARIASGLLGPDTCRIAPGMPQVFQDIRVIDLGTGPAAGFATALLADFGADVVKLEAPAGDRFRSMPSAPLWLRGKRSAVLDLV